MTEKDSLPNNYLTKQKQQPYASPTKVRESEMLSSKNVNEKTEQAMLL